MAPSVSKSEQLISRVLYTVTIYLGGSSRSPSSDRTRGSAGRLIPPYSILLRMGFARHAAYTASGRLLPCLFTITPFKRAVCFLWHFPSARADRALPGILPCGARTFLRGNSGHGGYPSCSPTIVPRP